MIFIAVSPGEYISILYQNRHSIHPLNNGVRIDVIRKYQYLRAKCAILKSDNQLEMGKWFGVFQSFRWDVEVVSSNEWKNYFGLYPENPDDETAHWINVVKLRYPMMSVRPDNYEPILMACYLRDRTEQAGKAVFA
tara:strand:+ start:174 stop:581 length:408 start_codon:yes stop_codon:yes gene_type:complete